MNIDTFLIECLSREIKIETDGKNIHVEHVGALKPATADFIRKYKQGIIKALLDQSHGRCVGCGGDTACMLTKPDGSWCWKCTDCFDHEHGVHVKNSTAAIV